MATLNDLMKLADVKIAERMALQVDEDDRQYVVDSLKKCGLDLPRELVWDEADPNMLIMGGFSFERDYEDGGLIIKWRDLAGFEISPNYGGWLNEVDFAADDAGERLGRVLNALKRNAQKQIKEQKEYEAAFIRCSSYQDGTREAAVAMSKMALEGWVIVNSSAAFFEDSVWVTVVWEHPERRAVAMGKRADEIEAVDDEQN